MKENMDPQDAIDLVLGIAATSQRILRANPAKGVGPRLAAYERELHTRAFEAMVGRKPTEAEATKLIPD